MWYLYIIETENDKLYTGITTDVERRFNEHLNEPKGAKFLKANPPKKVVYTEEFSSRSEATKREMEVKKLKKNEKLKLIQGLK
jgi:putative endonuclease